MKKRNFLILSLAALPLTALAHNGTLRLGISETHASLSGASATMPGATLGVGGLYRGVGIRAGVSYAHGAGASLETFWVRATASPRAVLSPYLSAGAIDLASLSGATSTATDYQVSSGGLISPVTTTIGLPTRGVVMGFGFVGLRAHYILNPRFFLTAHAGIGAGVGGSAAGLSATSQGGGSPFATSLGVGMRYRVTGHATAALSYSRVAIPIRGATFRSSGVSLTVARRFQ